MSRGVSEAYTASAPYRAARQGGGLVAKQVDGGLVLVYTGNGKGKTTAALGLALRAVGHGKSVLMIQFMKGGDEYGELRAAGMLPRFSIVQKGLPTFVDRDSPAGEDVRLASEGMDLARAALRDEEWDLVILDEINVAVEYGLVSAADMLELLDLRRPDTDMVFTGRGAHPDLVRRADMVSEVLEIKHHYSRGVPARKGIEY